VLRKNLEVLWFGNPKTLNFPVNHAILLAEFCLQCRFSEELWLLGLALALLPQQRL
jgi:hypothetical protein